MAPTRRSTAAPTDPPDYFTEMLRAIACRQAYDAIILCENSCPRYCPCPECRGRWRFLRANVPHLRREVLG